MVGEKSVQNPVAVLLLSWYAEFEEETVARSIAQHLARALAKSNQVVQRNRPCVFENDSFRRHSQGNANRTNWHSWPRFTLIGFEWDTNYCWLYKQSKPPSVCRANNRRCIGGTISRRWTTTSQLHSRRIVPSCWVGWVSKTSQGGFERTKRGS